MKWFAEITIENPQTGESWPTQRVHNNTLHSVFFLAEKLVSRQLELAHLKQGLRVDVHFELKEPVV